MATSRIRSEPSLVVIVGPTASGKTGLAVRVAKQFNGEVISADSRAIYKGLSIGTAKPTQEERDGVPHWGIDLVAPGSRFTAADFQEYANKKITEIRSKGKLPIIVGGTGLYIDAVLYDFQFVASADNTSRRDELMDYTLQELLDYCIKNNIILPENTKNKRHIVNNILRNGAIPQRNQEPRKNTIVVGISTEKETLRTRIEERAETIVTQETVAEALECAAVYGWDNEAMTGNIYPLIHQYIDGELTRSQLKEKSIIADWRLAKRQLTWFRRNEHIRWLSLDEAYTYIARRLEPLNNS